MKGPSAAQPSVSHDRRNVAFVPSDGGSLWVVGADLVSPRMILSAPQQTIDNPVWSPDDSRIAYILNVTQIWVVKTDGTQAHMVTAYPSVVVNLAWSPRTSQLAFVGQQYGEGVSLNIADADAAPATPRVISPPGSRGVNHPSWSTRGDRLAYMTDTDLDIIRPDGSQFQRIGQGANSYCSGASWLPEDTEIVYTLTQCGGYFGASGTGAFIVSDRGGTARPIGSSTMLFPNWSPDGQTMVAIELTSDAAYLVRAGADGADFQRITTGNGWPGWTR